MTYVVSDLHGCLQKWNQLLKKLSFSEEDTMFVLGDTIDRGKAPIPLLLDLTSRKNVISLLGNHEYMFLQSVHTLPLSATIDDFTLHLDDKNLLNLMMWISDGGRVTLEQYLALSRQKKARVLDYIKESLLYKELCVGERKFVLTHSGLSHFEQNRPLEEYGIKDFLFDRPTPSKQFWPDRLLIFGHTPTFLIPDHPVGEILRTSTYINIDCGAAFEKSGVLACLCLETLEVIYVP